MAGTRRCRTGAGAHAGGRFREGRQATRRRRATLLPPVVTSPFRFPANRPLRICIGPKEIGGQIPDYAAGFRALGHEVTTVISEPHPFFGESGYDLDLRTPEGQARLGAMVDRTDVFLFQFGTSLLPGNADLPKLQAAGKAIIAICNGDDVRHASAYTQEFGVPLATFGAPYADDPLGRPAQTLRNMERHATLVVSVPNQAGLALRPYLHFAYPMDLGLYRAHIPDREVPVVVHAPSDRAVKGTAAILAGLERLAARGVRFELRLLEGLPNAQVREALADADVAIDQLHMSYGKFAAEALASGCATAVVNYPALEPFARLRPLHAIGETTLDADLERLLTDRALRRTLAQAGPDHVRRYHDRTAVCARLVQALEALSAGRLRYDYYPTFFATQYALPKGVEFTTAQRQLATEIVARWGAPEGADLAQLVRRGLLDPDPAGGSGSAVPTWRADDGLAGAGDDPAAVAARFDAPDAPPSALSTAPARAPRPWPARDPDFGHYRDLTSLTGTDPAGRALREQLEPTLRLGLTRGALQEVLGRAMESPAALRASALLLLGTGQWADARDLLAIARDQDPSGVLAYYHAVAQLFAGQPSEALASMREAIGKLPRRPRLLVFGSTPILNNRYWVEALREGGTPACSLMGEYYGRINRREDFDWYFTDLAPEWTMPGAERLLGPYHAFLFLLLCGRALHTSFDGGPLGWTPFAPVEPELLKAAGVRTVVIPYGSDGAIYGLVMDPSHRHALLASYPEGGRNEATVRAKVDRWCATADCVVASVHSFDGHGRWDVLPANSLAIDVRLWHPAPSRSAHDGTTGAVRVLHSPNHRGYKGTEFLVAAVEQLRAEGLQVELDLVEGVQNAEVRRRMQHADILAEQFIAPTYALSAVEGMASGLPVMANTGTEMLRVMRRFSWMEECPVLATSIEELVPHLRRLVTDPALRHALGRAGREYVLKYHDYGTARELFGAIHATLDGTWEGPRLIDLYHPLLGIRRQAPRVAHPLRGGRLTDGAAG